MTSTELHFRVSQGIGSRQVFFCIQGLSVELHEGTSSSIAQINLNTEE
jgi:hypothetical protein